MKVVWWTVAVAVALLTVWGLADALADLRRAPGFDGVLRLVVEAVAGGVVIAFCIGRARSRPTPADDRRGNSAEHRQDGEAHQADLP